MDTVVHSDGYRKLNEKELKRFMEQNLAGKDFASWVRAFHKRKYDSDFAREMNRSVKEYLKSF